MRKSLFAATLALTCFAAHAEVIDIDNAELEALMKKGVPVVDIRTLPEWEQTGIVGGSRLLTFFDERGQADPAGWLKKVAPIAKPDQPIILICRTGNRTKRVSEFMSKEAGYAKVYNVTKGIKGWAEQGKPVTPAASSIADCRNTKTC